MEKAIRDSDLGVNPNNEGTQLRIVLPQMTEERRRDMIKIARQKGEEAKVAIRNIRRKAKEELDRLVKDGEVGEDEGRRAEKDLDDLTQRYVATVDEMIKHKESRAARGLSGPAYPSRHRVAAARDPGGGPVPSSCPAGVHPRRVPGAVGSARYPTTTG